MISLPTSETARKISAWWSTGHSLRQKDLYADRFFEFFVFSLFFYIERNNIGLSSKTLQQARNHSILRVYRTVLRKIKKWILRKKYKYSNILADCEEKHSGVVKPAFTETIGSLGRSFFWNICFFYQFCNLSENFSAFLWKIFGEVVITELVVSKGTYWEKLKKLFFRKEYKSYILLGDCKEGIGMVVNTAFTETIGSLCRSIFWIICFFNAFVCWTKKFWPLKGKYFKMFQKIPSSCPWEYLEEK